MKKLLLLVVMSAVALTLLTGCNKSGSGINLSSGGSSSTGGGTGGSGDTGGGTGGTDTPLAAHHPEPATLALLGTGLGAYVMMRRKKKK